jgi:hypothetical protein
MKCDLRDTAFSVQDAVMGYVDVVAELCSSLPHFKESSVLTY